jgi:hypothetical protein
MNNNCFDEGDVQNCMLRSAVDTIISLGLGVAPVNKQFEKLSGILESINSNTGSDQTDSYYIKAEIEDIKDILKQHFKEQE